MKTRWLLARTAQAVFTVWFVVTLTFGMIRLLPGGPMDYLRAQLIQSSQGTITQQEMQRINAVVESYINIQPDQPIWQQYIDYMSSLLVGNMGKSVWFGDSVNTIIANALPWTLFIMSVSLLLSFAIGIAIGAGMAFVEGSKTDVGITVTAMFVNSVPYYIVAILAVYFLGYQLQWFPTGGRWGGAVEPNLSVDFLGNVLYHAALPLVSLIVTGWGGRAIGMRGNAVRVMGEDYIRVAELRGLNPRRITLGYIARNAILPMYTSLLIAIGFMFGGAVILETIFNYKGLGFYLFRAVEARDYPLMMGTFLVITVAVIISIFFADLTYGKLDPRVESGGEHESY